MKYILSGSSHSEYVFREGCAAALAETWAPSTESNQIVFRARISRLSLPSFGVRAVMKLKLTKSRQCLLAGGVSRPTEYPRGQRESESSCAVVAVRRHSNQQPAASRAGCQSGAQYL